MYTLVMLRLYTRTLLKQYNEIKIKQNVLLSYLKLAREKKFIEAYTRI